MPDDLVQQARAYGISIAEVAGAPCVRPWGRRQGHGKRDGRFAQEAAQTAAKRIGQAESSRIPTSTPAESVRNRAFNRARRQATAEEMRTSRSTPGLQVTFVHQITCSTAGATDIDTAYRYYGHPGRQDWSHFQAAVRKGWEAMRAAPESLAAGCPPSPIGTDQPVHASLSCQAA